MALPMTAPRIGPNSARVEEVAGAVPDHSGSDLRRIDGCTGETAGPNGPPDVEGHTWK